MQEQTTKKNAVLSSGGAAECAVDTGDLIRELSRIAFSAPNDAIALASGRCGADIRELDLAAVAEFKQKEEQVEIKFLDRVRAMQVLFEILNARESRQENGAALAFLQALKETTGESGAVE